MGIAHFDQASAHEHELGHIRGRRTMVGLVARLERFDYWDGEH